jgi:hypothetical protein
MLGTTAPVTQDFALSARLPEDHPLFNDGSGLFHDIHFPVKALRRAALFVARRYFRVPTERQVVFSAAEVDTVELEPWRRTGRAAHCTMDLVVHPADVVNGVPRGLECESVLSIEGVRCSTARGRMVFLVPGVYHNHRERNRAADPACARSADADELSRRPRPEAVGRSDPRNLVISGPLMLEDGRMRVRVAPNADYPGLSGPADHVPAMVMVEATRQAAFLLAGELYGFSAGDCVLTRWSAQFQGFVEPDVPLYCTATAGTLRREDGDRPVLPVNLVFDQGSRRIGTVDVSVLQDC